MNRISRILTAAALVIMLSTGIALATNVTFQVNMSVQQQLGYFSPTRDSVCVRGSFNGWAGWTNKLTEGAGLVYTGTFDLPAGAIEYKFVMDTAGTDNVWESNPNRTATVESSPLVIPVVYFNNIEAPVNVEVLFRVNMQVQILNGNFNPDVDWVVIRGAHNALGNWGGAVRLLAETGNPNVYSLWIQFSGIGRNTPVEYKFVYLTNGDVNSAHWESVSNRSFAATGTEQDLLPPPSGNGFGELYPSVDPPYFSNVSPADIITQNVNVVFQVDARPLYGRLHDQGYIVDVQSGDTVHTVEHIEAAGFFNSWPWGNFGSQYELNDNGVSGDVAAGDTVWSGTILFNAGSPRVLIYKYGANMLDVEGGVERNHSVTLSDAQTTFVIPSDCWGNTDTLFQHWGCLLADAPEPVSVQPNSYRLDQNFPNPFNPTTTISFTIPKDEMVTLRVFDLTGREVTTLSYGRLAAGAHTMMFDGSKLASGVYFYRLESGSFNATRKMLLLK
jgi:hypothetical protein